ncbi:polysaccharide deacetylase family protein [Bacteroidota bacterium]
MNKLIHLSRRKILLPFYHTINDTKLPHIGDLYNIRSIKTFLYDLDFFCKYYDPISIDRLHEIIENNIEIKKPVFHLTFDDGLREFYTIVAPTLEERGIPATVFVNTDFIDNKELFFRYKISLIIEKLNSINDKKIPKEVSILIGTLEENVEARLINLTHNDQHIINQIAELLNLDYIEYLVRNQPYLSSEEIKDLKNRGFTIGSHSTNHPFFKNLTIKDQKNQISKSFQFLEKQFDVKNKYFSFPFSDERVEKQLFNWLYKEEHCKLSFGISGLKDDISKYHLHRIPMEDSNKSAGSIIKSEYIYFLLKAIVGKNKIARA